MSVLSALHLAKQYKSRQVVKDVTFQVTSGEVVGLLGPNGAGKTTSFYMIVGLIPCDQGTIMLSGHEVTHHPMYKRAQLGLGYLPQEASIFRKLSVVDNIMAIIEMQKHLTRAQRKQRLNSLLEELQLQHLRSNLGMSLSGGERRRVEIARALASEPRFILLDEPFAGIDPLSVIEIQRIIAHLSSLDIGVLITDHQVRETLQITDRSYVIRSGTVLCHGAPEEVLANPEARKYYFGEGIGLST